MFEPVTMTRSASVTGGAGAAPVGGGSGGRGFCANAFDAIGRGIPTQATRVMRRNPNLQSSVLVMVSPLVKGGILRQVHAAPRVKSRRIPTKPKGGRRCQAKKLVL